MGLIISIITFATTIFRYIKERTQALHDLRLAALQSKTDIIKSKINSDTDWEIAILSNESNGLRWASFIIATSSLWANIISLTWGQRINYGWNNLSPMDAEIVRLMLLAIWGIKPITRIIGGCVGTFANALKKYKS